MFKTMPRITGGGGVLFSQYPEGGGRMRVLNPLNPKNSGAQERLTGAPGQAVGVGPGGKLVPVDFGGRNYISGSASIQATRVNTTNSWLSEKFPVFRCTSYGVSELRKGGSFCLSFDYEINGVTTPTALTLNLKGSDAGYVTVAKLAIQAGNNKGTFKAVIVPTEAQMLQDGSFMISGFGAGQNANATVSLQNVKFERGTVATDWMPAPEDPPQLSGATLTFRNDGHDQWIQATFPNGSYFQIGVNATDNTPYIKSNLGTQLLYSTSHKP